MILPMLRRHIVLLYHIRSRRSAKSLWSVLFTSISADHETDNTQYLIRFRNFYSGTALLIGLENAQILPKELAGFRRLIHTEGQYEFYRSQWPRAPALPFLPVHRYDKNWETKTHDFFRFISYREWRRQGKEDDLNGYAVPDSAWTDTSSDLDRKANESGIWHNMLAYAKFLVELLCRYSLLCRFTASRWDSPKHPAHQTPMQRGLELNELDGEFGIEYQEHISRHGSIAALVAPSAVHVR
jgi:hypothetical protein